MRKKIADHKQGRFNAHLKADHWAAVEFLIKEHCIPGVPEERGQTALLRRLLEDKLWHEDPEAFRQIFPSLVSARLRGESPEILTTQNIRHPQQAPFELEPTTYSIQTSNQSFKIWRSQ